MKNGDQVVLMVKENGETRMKVKELLINDDGLLAITTPMTAPGWPDQMDLRRDRLEASPLPAGPRDLYFYQDDVVRHT